MAAALLGSAAAGGVFFAFSSFVMRGLTDAGSTNAVPAMQQINVAAVRPPLMILLFGTLVVMGAAVVVQSRDTGWSAPAVIAFGVYLVGVVGVTAFGNVPLNNELAAFQAGSSVDAWAAYAPGWTWLNHARTIASLASAGLLAAALRVG